MREKSQLEDMRAALRGDLERARARREEDPWRQSAPQPPIVPQPDPDVVPTPEPEPEPAPDPDVLPEPEPDPARPPDPAPAPPPEPAPTPAASRPGFFARLFGR